ncbi:hypothetical protein EON64_14540 [archaeon]|nr:MAG: hypothetical protein EON64_14540 [archaeon]
MEKTRAYKQILVVGLMCCVLAGLFFLCMLFSDNFAALLVSFAVLGFAVLPLLPVMMENCAEVTYPVSEDMAMGILLTGKEYQHCIPNVWICLLFALGVCAMSPLSIIPVSVYFAGCNLSGLVFIFILQVR